MIHRLFALLVSADNSIWLERFVPEILPEPQPIDRMDATALNDRRGSGMRCRGFLGRPTVVMLG